MKTAYSEVCVHRVGVAAETWVNKTFRLKLYLESNTEAVCEKVRQHLFFLGKMNSFKVCNALMTLFDQCFIESVLTVYHQR